MVVVRRHIQLDLLVAEQLYYLVRTHCPDAPADHVSHFQKAILDAGGFSTEIEGLIDIAEARAVLR